MSTLPFLLFLNLKTTIVVCLSVLLFRGLQFTCTSVALLYHPDACTTNGLRYGTQFGVPMRDVPMTVRGRCGIGEKSVPSLGGNFNTFQINLEGVVLVLY